jgi:hypothetical protein
MTYLEDETLDNDIFRICFSVFAVASGAMFVVQVLFLQQLKLLAIYLLPFLSFCMCFENAALARGSTANKDAVSEVAKVCHAFVVPLFVAVLNEVDFGLHKARSERFFFVHFDEGCEIALAWERVELWGVRLLAAVLFVMNLFVNFEIGDAKSDTGDAGEGGYLQWRNRASSTALALALIPPIFLTFWALLHTITMSRYGAKMTISLNNNRRWKVPIPCALFYGISIIFADTLFPIMSNAGEVVLLFGTSYMLFLVQNDLSIVASFADFLHRSNLVFARSCQLQQASNVSAGQRSSGQDANVDTSDEDTTFPNVDSVELTRDASEV